jgi:hypothetical protein
MNSRGIHSRLLDREVDVARLVGHLPLDTPLLVAESISCFRDRRGHSTRLTNAGQHLASFSGFQAARRLADRRVVELAVRAQLISGRSAAPPAEPTGAVEVARNRQGCGSTSLCRTDVRARAVRLRGKNRSSDLQLARQSLDISGATENVMSATFARHTTRQPRPATESTTSIAAK